MNERGQLLLAASLLALSAFLLYRNRQQIVTGSDALLEYAGEAVEQGIDYMKNLTRGERNNNPGNLVKSSIQWRGKIPGADTRFESFDTPENGIRAIGTNLRTYYNKYGINTVRGIISRYAPSNENDTAAYIAAVSSALGVTPDTALNVNDPGTLNALVNAIIKHENGRVSYAQNMIAESLGIA